MAVTILTMSSQMEAPVCQATMAIALVTLETLGAHVADL